MSFSVYVGVHAGLFWDGLGGSCPSTDIGGKRRLLGMRKSL